MSDDFQVGDVVVCVDVHTPNREGRLPLALRLNATYRISAVYIGKYGDVGVSVVQADPRPGARGFKAFRFRKLPPADEAFTLQMRALRPHKNRMPA